MDYFITLNIHTNDDCTDSDFWSNIDGNTPFYLPGIDKEFTVKGIHEATEWTDDPNREKSYVNARDAFKEHKKKLFF